MAGAMQSASQLRRLLVTPRITIRCYGHIASGESSGTNRICKARSTADEFARYAEERKQREKAAKEGVKEFAVEAKKPSQILPQEFCRDEKRLLREIGATTK